MFEFDPVKSASNLDKHGIDFNTAQAIWSDPDLLTKPALNPSEERFIATGKIGSRIWTAVFTMRGNNIRIISVRRARAKEIANYGADES